MKLHSNEYFAHNVQADTVVKYGWIHNCEPIEERRQNAVFVCSCGLSIRRSVINSVRPPAAYVPYSSRR